MTQPVTIDHDNRRITFQIGKVIPPTDMRATYHRLLDQALDALAGSIAVAVDETTAHQVDDVMPPVIAT